MTKFSPEQRARIFTESRRLLEEESTPERPTPVREPPPIEFEEPVAKWKREANEADARRKAADTARRAAADLQAATWWSEVDERIAAALEVQRREIMDVIQTVINAGAETSETVGKIDNKLAGLQTLLKRLNDGESSMNARHQQEYARLRDEFASERAMHARELGLVTKQLTETQAALARVDDRRERARDREQLGALSTNVDNVVQLIREDIASRNGGAA